MNSIEATLQQWCPVAGSRAAMYSIFMVKGEVPFAVRDLEGLWDEWRGSDLATHAVAKRGMHPLKRFGPVTKKGYNGQWVSEREKFYNLFSSLISFSPSNTSASIFLIYPNGKEVSWEPGTGMTTKQYSSNRGPQLAAIMKALKHEGDMGLVAVVQYSYKDDPALYAVPSLRGAEGEAVMRAIEKTSLDRSDAVPLLPTMTDEALPLQVWRDFWSYYRSSSSYLSSKYGKGEGVTPTFEKFKGLYHNEKTQVKAFFNRLEEADKKVDDNKLVMANFIYDAGFQYVLVRLTPSLRVVSQDRWTWFKLPATPGTKHIGSMAPPNVRMVVKGIYMES